MSPREESPRHTVYIDEGVIRAHVEKPDKIPLIPCFLNKLKFLFGREDRLENEVHPVRKTLVPHFGGQLCCSEHRLGRIPIAESLLCDVVGVDVDTVLCPLVIEELDCCGCLAGAIWASYDAECRTDSIRHDYRNYL